MSSGSPQRLAKLATGLAKPAYLIAAVLALKLYVVRWVVFSSGDVVRFLLTDVSAALLVVVAIEGRRLGRRMTFLVADGVMTTLLVVLLVFHSYFGRLPSLQVLGFTEQVGAVRDSVIGLLKPSLLAFYADLVPLGFLAWWRPDFFARRLHFRARGSMLIVALLVAGVDVGLAVARPMPDFTLAAEAHGIVNEEVADWVRREFIPPKRARVTGTAKLQARVDELRTGLKEGERSSEETGPLAGAGKGRNVIFIVAESLQQFLLDRSIAGQKVTPSIDALAAEGYRFDRVFTQIAVGTTSDAEQTVQTSLMPFENKLLVTAYPQVRLPGLPRMLKAAGYTTMVFHTDEISFWSRDKLYPALGFGGIFDARFFGNKDVIGLGPSDDVLFEKALPELQRAAKDGKPFFATIVTMTAHDPFPLPQDRATLALPADQMGTRAGRYLESQHYADAALGRFIGGLKKAGLYEDSVIVLVGDHFGLQRTAMSAEDVRIVSGLMGREYGEVDRLNVPFIIAMPGSGLTGRVQTPGGQVDVMPTLAAVMGLPADGDLHLGRDLTIPGQTLLGLRYHNPTGTYIDDSALVIPRGSAGFEAWSVQTGERLGEVPQDAEAKSKRVIEIEQISDDYVSNLPRRSLNTTRTR